MTMPEEHKIWVTSLVAMRDQKPRVDIHLNDLHVQLDAPAAIQFAQQIIETTMGAYADAFIVNFLIDKVFSGKPDGKNIAVQIMAEFREYRDELARHFKAEDGGA